MSAKVTTIWINGRFLGRPVTGVERVAREILTALVTEYLDDQGGWESNGERYQFKLVAPAAIKGLESPWPELELVQTGWLRGHKWEQTELAWFTAGEWLLSLCNTGPLLKRKQLIFIHDAQPFAIPDNFSFGFRSWYRILYNVAGRCSARVLVNSKFTRGELTKHLGLDENKIDACLLGVEHVSRSPVDTAVLDGLQLPDQPFVLAVSSANPNKNFRGVIRALEIMGEEAPPCVIVGQRNQAHFGGVSIDMDRVYHAGYVTDEQLNALYARARCLVFPSFYEGFGLPPLEAMSLGCPVIVSETSSMPEVAGGAALYCRPDDPGTIANAIATLFGSAEIFADCKQAGLERAAAFSWQKAAKTIVDSITRATGGAKDSAAELPLKQKG